ncbi:hypothetical protein LOAG_04166 [Loa loa]|uniref:Uncharacterized protein n=2 Tax=Loa loa TaxID=7209 RepID=A0A1S0U4E9_LOALO|nr:hypothetical protein LOAG_04166 [Loa loa]EFO24320.1 hypothetical protein LOAG_04166 [Loa loa]
MGSFGSKSTSVKSHVEVKGKKSQRKEMKPLDAKQSISKPGSYTKKDPITDVEMKQTGSTIMRRQRDKSLKEELSRRIKIVNPTEMQPELTQHSLRDKVGTSKSKGQVTQNRDMDKEIDDNMEKTQEQCTRDIGS